MGTARGWCSRAAARQAPVRGSSAMQCGLAAARPGQAWDTARRLTSLMRSANVWNRCRFSRCLGCAGDCNSSSSLSPRLRPMATTLLPIPHTITLDWSQLGGVATDRLTLPAGRRVRPSTQRERPTLCGEHRSPCASSVGHLLGRAPAAHLPRSRQHPVLHTCAAYHLQVTQLQIDTTAHP
jgi:hypothetical protein